MLFCLGLEDTFWLLFLIIIIAFSVVKSVTRVGWSQLFYMILGSIFILIVLYVFATAFNKLVLEDSSTAHWNAHARFTQAAIQSRLKEEEQRVHVIAPPKMGGAKLNIIYTVGDVPLARDSSKSSRHPSSGSLGVQNALCNLTQQTVSTAAAALITPTALPSSPSSTPVTTTPNTSTTTSPNNSKTSASASTSTNKQQLIHRVELEKRLAGSGTDSATPPTQSPISSIRHCYQQTPKSPLTVTPETIEEERIDSPSCTNTEPNQENATTTSDSHLVNKDATKQE